MVTNNLNISEMDLMIKFKAYGIDYNQFLKDIETEFLWQSLVAKIYLERIKVNADQINFELNQILNSKKKIV